MITCIGSSFSTTFSQYENLKTETNDFLSIFVMHIFSFFLYKIYIDFFFDFLIFVKYFCYFLLLFFFLIWMDVPFL